MKVSISAPREAALVALAALAVAGCERADSPGAVSAAASGGAYTVPRTLWGDPDLQGKWPSTQMVGVPVQRDEKLGTRNVLNDEEFADREARAARQTEQDNADFDIESAKSTPAGDVGGPVSPPPHWLERGSPQRQASLIVDPPNGRMPPFTEAAQQRQAELRKAREGRGPADSYTDRSLYDRCITRGVAGSVLPVIYNNGNQIVQAPGYVAIVNEMIHETRIVPLDGRAHVSSDIKMLLGDSRGHFEGDTLVVETTNLTDRTGVGLNGGGARHSAAAKITERFTRTAADKIDYKLTIDDPQTWTAPWTMEMPLKRDDSYGMYEYACHEGNYALHNILSGARADERAAAAAEPEQEQPKKQPQKGPPPSRYTWRCERSAEHSRLYVPVRGTKPAARARCQGRECRDMARRYGRAAQKKVKRAMHKRKRGTLRSGRSGKKVTSRKQAIAIGLSEARRRGAKVPKKQSKS